MAKAKASRPAKYKLNVQRDVDVDGYGDETSYILNLPYGHRFDDEIVHVRGYDTMAELRKSVRLEVEPCDCPECKAGLAAEAITAGATK